MNVLCIGAHPDDCENSVGGTAVRLVRRGDSVTFVSVTDGRRGHYRPEYLEDPYALIDIRRKESIAAAKIGGVGFGSMGIPDGEVYVDRESTEEMIRLIRSAKPDLVLLNRPSDYHRDHRYTAQLVLDAAYMLTVPFLCPQTPALRTMPVFAYWQDGFTEGGAFRPDVVVPIDDEIDTKVEMMLAHASQYLDWLVYNAEPGSPLADLPEEPTARRARAAEALKGRSRGTATRYADRLPTGTRFAEAFQISEYGHQPPREEWGRLFGI